MANLTLSLDDDVLRRARERAAANGTSVNQLVRDYLERFVGPSDSAARTRILTLADAAQSSSGPGGRSWDRASLYDR
jgi:plasmid stability protein